MQCLFPAETSALRGCFLALNRSKKKHPQTPSGANAQTGRVAGAFFILGNSALAGLEVVHFLIGLIDQVVHAANAASGKPYQIEISIGCARLEPDIATVHDLIDKADQEMYHLKTRKRGTAPAEKQG